MADFGYLSDTDDSAVEDLISQAQELCVLEQVSKINYSSFSNSILPSDLETRFRKLKSFPVSTSKTTTPTLNSKTDVETEIFSPRKTDPGGKINSSTGEFCPEQESPLNSSTRKEIISTVKENVDGEKGLEKKSRHGSLFSPSDSPNSWTEIENFTSSTSKYVSNTKSNSASKLKSGSFGSSLGSSNSSMDSPSPPQKTGCFWCSPKRVSKKKNKENWKIDWGDKNDDDDDDEFLSVLNTFSAKEQQKMLRKAMKEEENISREAEKIVKWAKQASDRMNFHGIEDELSDDNKTKF